MTLLYEKHQGLLLEIFYTEDNYCFASCEHPFRLEIIESELCYTPKQAFDRLKGKIDLIYADYKDDLGEAM
ncbi:MULTISPECIES: hypothetical protein [unclassified Nostoc]|uniref:hypothetical protein n=1 Tax=unclassified Nostoc TaxID=2593658 RepID=UPI000B95656F|nr:hypothetical protein [Nostoc sp. 'Peltigera membranacea cyanobiont' 232]OYD99780.1 hypothetical protein CDG79_38930 [Nostoc sp. 'Peltigera membranacea cyanobiont' 232]